MGINPITGIHTDSQRNLSVAISRAPYLPNRAAHKPPGARSAQSFVEGAAMAEADWAYEPEGDDVEATFDARGPHDLQLPAGMNTAIRGVIPSLTPVQVDGAAGLKFQEAAGLTWRIGYGGSAFGRNKAFNRHKLSLACNKRLLSACMASDVPKDACSEEHFFVTWRQFRDNLSETERSVYEFKEKDLDVCQTPAAGAQKARRPQPPTPSPSPTYEAPTATTTSRPSSSAL